MVSTAFLLDVIVYGLIAAVVVPVIDLILFTMRSSREPGFRPFESAFDADRRSIVDAEPPTRRPAGRRGSAESRSAALATANAGSFAGKGESRKRVVAGSSSEIVGGRAGGRQDIWPQPNVVSPRTEGPVGYVASNGIVVTPNMSSFREMAPATGGQVAAAAHGQAAAAPAEMTAISDAQAGVAESPAPTQVFAVPASTEAIAAPAGHPHSEYWRHGSAHFYESI